MSKELQTEISQTKTLKITGAEHLDPVTVFLEDISESCGRIVIHCYGEAWANYWGGMGDEDIANFFYTAETSYLADKLFRGQRDIVDFEKLAKTLREIAGEDEDYELTCSIDGIEGLESHYELHEYKDTLKLLLGEDWYHQLPYTQCGKFQYLCRIIDAVKLGLEKSGLVEKKDGE